MTKTCPEQGRDAEQGRETEHLERLRAVRVHLLSLQAGEGTVYTDAHLRANAGLIALAQQRLARVSARQDKGD